MRGSGFLLFLVVVACTGIAGCMQLSGAGPGTAAAPVTSLPAADPATPASPVSEAAVPTPAATSTPQQIVTIVHQISLVKDMKDSDLLFTLQVPVEWSLSTRRIANPENFEGFMYQTDLVTNTNNTFYIHTFSNYRYRDQNYRDDARRWVPAPNETVVTINGITFDRFQSTANGTTRVTYVARQSSMNDHGYLSVLAYSVDDSNRFAVEDYDKVVASFRYISKDLCTTTPGEEIVRVLPEKQEGGSARSAVKSSESSTVSAPSTCHRTG